MRRAFSRLAALRLDIEVDRLVVRALRAAAPGTRQLLVKAGLDAGLRREDTINRAATCFFASSAFNSDDLSDDDCDYLPPAPAQAVVLILHSLFVAGLRDLHLPPDVEGQVLQDLVAAEEAQVLETISTSWDATRLRIVTDGIAGSQWSAYLRVMWALARGWSNSRPTSPGTSAEWLSSPVTSRRPIPATTPCQGQTGGLYLRTL